MSDKRIAIYPGSFNPFHYGHLDIIKRASVLFDELIVAVLINENKEQKMTHASTIMMRDVCKEFVNVKVMFSPKPLIDFAKDCDAKFVIKGLRNAIDFSYEVSMERVNKDLDPEIETFFLISSIKNSYISSSMIRILDKMGKDVSMYVPYTKNSFGEMIAKDEYLKGE